MRFALILTAAGCLATTAFAKDRFYKTDNLERKFAKKAQPRVAPSTLTGGRHLVAFTEPINESLAEQLASQGISTIGLSFKENDFFLYAMDFRGKEKNLLPLLRGTPTFIDIQPEQVEDKVDSRILRSESMEYVGKTGSFRATVKLRTKPTAEVFQEVFRDADSAEADPFDSCIVHIVAHRAVALKMAESKEVEWLGRRYYRNTLNAPSRTLSKVDLLQTGFVTPVSPPTTQWLSGIANTGDGVSVGISEYIDSLHLDFRERAPDGSNKLRKAYPTESWYQYGLSHGTHVASIAAGNGWNSQTSTFFPGSALQWRGVAPKALLSPSNHSNVNNYSTGHDLEYYGWLASYHDSLMSRHTRNLDASSMENRVRVFSAGNNGVGVQYGTQQGYYSMLNHTKNGTKVGATYVGTVPVKGDFSGMGPTRDGRVGVDVLAPGTGYIGGFAVELDYVSLKNGANVKYTWGFTGSAQGWGQGPPYSDRISQLSEYNGTLNFNTDGGAFIFSGPMSPRPVSALSDSLIFRYRARPINGMIPATIHGRIFWKRPQDEYVKGCCATGQIPAEITGMQYIADYTWREARIALNDPRWKKNGGGWVNGDELDKIRLDFPGRGGIVAAGSETQDYVMNGGTSMATPHVTGITALMVQKYRDQVLKARCNTCTLDNWPMWNSSVRALLVHTAQDMIDESGVSPGNANPDFAAAGFNQSTIFGKGPDFATGFGFVDAEKAVRYVSPYRYLEDNVSQGGIKLYNFPVPAGTSTVRVTLAWDDPPMLGVNDASTAYAVKLVNDLDLEVIDLNTGRRYSPWVLDHQGLHNGTLPANGIDLITPDMIRARAAKPGRDSLNNLEVVDIEAPPSGSWAIQVRGHSIAVDQNPTLSGINQDFSLVFDFDAVATSTLYLAQGMNQQILAGGNSTVTSLKANGTVWTWGLNFSGEAGRTAPYIASTPGQVTGLPTIQAVSSHRSSSLVLAQNGLLYAWGVNYGQIGDGTLTARPTPVQVCNSSGQPCFGNRYRIAATGPTMSAAIQQNGRLWVWGDNASGYLGASNPSQILYPMAVGNDRDWVWVSAGDDFFVALKADGSIWGWGENGLGQLGLGTGIAKVFPPMRIGTAIWKTVRAGAGDVLGIQNDGSLWGWGGNGWKNIHATQGPVFTPTRIGTDNDWKSVAPGYTFSMAMKQDGTTYTWGSNANGQLGRGFQSNQDYSAPEPVCNVTGQPCSGVKFQTLAASGDAVFALSTDGSSWAWGNNYGGAFGNGTTTSSYYPQKVAYASNVLSATVSSTTTAVSRNLTTEGARDWAHWGAAGATTSTRRAGMYPIVNSYTKIGTFTEALSSAGISTFTWSDGGSPRFSHSTVNSVTSSAINTGFQITVPAKPAPQTVLIYVAVNNATGRLDASLSDGSGLTYSNSSLTSTGRRDGYYEVTFSSLTGANLVLKWTKTAGSGEVLLQAAALK